MEKANLFFDEFEKSEIKGRKKLTDFLVQLNATNLTPTTNKFDQVDYYATIKNKNYVFEIKDRDLKDKRTGEIYTEILLGANKVNAIENRINRYKLDGGFYACFYYNTLYLFDVQHCPNRVGTQYCPATTSGDDHTMVLKPVYYFDIKNSWVVTKSAEDNKWHTVQRPEYV